MVYHGVHILSPAVKLDGVTTLFIASGEGFFLCVWPLRVIILISFLEYFSLFRRVLGAIHQSCFCTSRSINRISCIMFPALAGAEFLGAG